MAGEGSAAFKQVAIIFAGLNSPLWNAASTNSAFIAAG
jgi:hypothetical protein